MPLVAPEPQAPQGPHAHYVTSMYLDLWAKGEDKVRMFGQRQCIHLHTLDQNVDQMNSIRLRLSFMVVSTFCVPHYSFPFYNDV